MPKARADKTTGPKAFKALLILLAAMLASCDSPRISIHGQYDTATEITKDSER